MKDYIQSMRAMIGTGPLLLCGASVILFDENRRVLMLRRSDNGAWCFPGGTIELGDTTRETATREVFEETGLMVEDLQLFDVFSGEELHYTYPHGDEVYIVDIVYLSNRFAGEIKLDHESCEYEFFELDSIPDDLSPPVVPVVRALKRRHQGKRVGPT